MDKNNKEYIKTLLDNIIIIEDSRETNHNITNTFDNYNIKHKRKKLESGDYCAYIPADGKLLKEDLYSTVVIERKSGLDEISQNLTKSKDRFHREFERSDKQIIIMIENNSYEDLCEGNYKSQLKPKNFLSLLHSFVDRYNSSFVFIKNSKYSPIFIYKTLYYNLYNQLKIFIK